MRKNLRSERADLVASPLPSVPLITVTLETFGICGEAPDVAVIRIDGEEVHAMSIVENGELERQELETSVRKIVEAAQKGGRVA